MHGWQLGFEFRETNKLSNFLKIALPIQIILSIIALIVYCLTYPVAVRVSRDEDPVGSSDLHNLYQASAMLETIGTVMLILGVAVATATLVWIYRKHGNIAAMRVEGLKYQPGKAVITWLLPFINAITVFFSLRELYQASTSPQDMTQGRTGRNFLLFYICFLGTNLIQLVGFFLDDFPATEAFAASALSMAATATSLFFLRCIIVEIDHSQSSSFMKVNSERRTAKQATQAV